MYNEIPVFLFSIYFVEYVTIQNEDCNPKIREREYSNLLDALMACSRDRDCGAVSESSGLINQTHYHTCPYPPAAQFTYEDGKHVVIYQKSKFECFPDIHIIPLEIYYSL